MSEEQHISFETYLTALALFTVAASHYKKMREFERMLDRTLLVEEGSHIADALYRDEGGTRDDFDEALRRQGILVQPPEHS